MKPIFLAAAFWLAGAAAYAETVLKIGDQKGTTSAVMAAAGVLADAPYKIEWSEFPAAAPLLEAARAGAIDAGWCGDAPFTFAEAAGAPLKAVLATRSGQEQLAVVVRGDAPSQKFEDLIGKTIATGRGSIGHQLVLALLKQHGLKPDAVHLVFLSPADAGAALKSGAVDAWASWDPYVARLEVEDHDRSVANGVGLTPGLSFLFARDDAIADPEKRRLLQDFLTRYARARAWALAHPEEFGKTYAQLVGLSEAVGVKSIARNHVAAVAIDADVIDDEQKTIDLYVEAGLIPKKLDAATLVDPSFSAAVDQAREAAR